MTSSQFAAGVNDFTFNLLRQVDEKGNLVLSAKNISDCFGMLYPATKEETYTAFKKVLCYPDDPGVAGKYIGEINKSLAGDKECTIRTANGLWCQNSYPFDLGYMKLVKEVFGAQFATVDYTTGEFKPIVEEINGWVEAQTKGESGEGLIKNLVNEQFFSTHSVLTLVSAIYFLGKFKVKFNESLTRKQPFTCIGGKEDGKKLDCQMMTNQGNYHMADLDSCQVLTLPYAGDTMLNIILPKKKGSLADIEKNLTSAAFAALLSNGNVDDTVVMLPKFKIEGSIALNEPMKEMGLDVAFGDGANFRGLIDPKSVEYKQGVKISKAVHKAFVDTTEKGTEASAATAVGMARCTSAVIPKPPRMFKADHPFLFTITHRQTGCVLFVGRHTKPAGY